VLLQKRKDVCQHAQSDERSKAARDQPIRKGGNARLIWGGKIAGVVVKPVMVGGRNLRGESKKEGISPSASKGVATGFPSKRCSDLEISRSEGVLHIDQEEMTYASCFGVDGESEGGRFAWTASVVERRPALTPRQHEDEQTQSLGRFSPYRGRICEFGDGVSRSDDEISDHRVRDRKKAGKGLKP
jgi:hypothetical protein